MKTLAGKALVGASLIAAAGLNGCSGSRGMSMTLDEVRAAVDSGNATWIEAMRKQDPALLASLFDPQGNMLGSDGNVYRGPSGVQEAMGGLMQKWGPTETTIETDGLWVVDGVAVETGRYTYAFAPDGGKETVSRGRYVVRWKRQQDGSWKIETDLGLPD